MRTRGHCAGKDPVKEHLWECVDAVADTACAAAFALESPEEAFCALPATSWRWTRPQDSIGSDLSPPLICERAPLNQFANSAFFFGFLLGAAVWGTLSDRYGRRRTLIATMVLSGAVEVLSALMQGYAAVFASRIFQGAQPWRRSATNDLLCLPPASFKARSRRDGRPPMICCVCLPHLSRCAAVGTVRRQ